MNQNRELTKIESLISIIVDAIQTDSNLRSSNSDLNIDPIWAKQRGKWHPAQHEPIWPNIEEMKAKHLAPCHVD